MKNFMKYNRSLTGLVIGILALTTVSCSDWFDVSPKSQIPTDEHFSNERGFFDQLTGVYSSMARTSLYGREMTFGLTEVLAQNYDMGAESTYRYARTYDYENTNVKNRIDNIWSNMYNCIANLNLMLQYYETTNPAIFTGNHYNLYRGEALGLRAFLHFELMRAFAKSPASDGNAKGVPYVTEYAPKITVQKTVNETMDLIIGDLKEALTYLESDSLYCAASPYSHSDQRRYYFNYYAAKQILARAYLWKGDTGNAAQVAEEVIDSYQQNSSPVQWTHWTSVVSVTSEKKDRIFSMDLTFRLMVTDMVDIVDPYFASTAGVNLFYYSDDKVDKFFEVSSKGLGNDYRCVYGIDYVDAYRCLQKYHQYGYYDNIIPVIRKSEIYYIAAETQKLSNPQRAIELLNLVWECRHSSYQLPQTLTADEIQDEIFKEYRKEFLGEGQLFFYYKRLNYPSIEGASIAANNAVYVWDMPDNEIEFGNREN